MLFTILAGAKRHRLEPWAYLRDVLLHLGAGETDLESLLPDRWGANHPNMSCSTVSTSRGVKRADRRKLASGAARLPNRRRENHRQRCREKFGDLIRRPAARRPWGGWAADDTAPRRRPGGRGLVRPCAYRGSTDHATRE